MNNCDFLQSKLRWFQIAEEQMGILYVPYPRSFCYDYYWCNGHHKYVYIFLLYQDFDCIEKTSFIIFLVAGSIGDPASPASFGGWLGYTAINHSWVVSFVIMDLLFFGVITLTVIQASQVWTKLILTFFLFTFDCWNTLKFPLRNDSSPTISNELSSH